MIAISVNENGMLNTCTCRWNHDNGGDDNAMNAVEISKVVNVNFYETFKPNTKWKESGGWYYVDTNNKAIFSRSENPITIKELEEKKLKKEFPDKTDEKSEAIC